MRSAAKGALERSMVMRSAGAGPSISTHSLLARTRWWGLARRLALIGVVAAVAGCKAETAQEQAEVVRPVKVAVVAAAPQGRTLTYSGVVRPRIESNIGFRVSGKIV